MKWNFTKIQHHLTFNQLIITLWSRLLPSTTVEGNQQLISEISIFQYDWWEKKFRKKKLRDLSEVEESRWEVGQVNEISTITTTTTTTAGLPLNPLFSWIKCSKKTGLAHIYHLFPYLPSKLFVTIPLDQFYNHVNKKIYMKNNFMKWLLK